MTIPVIRFDHLEYLDIEKVLKSLRQLRLIDYDIRGVAWRIVRVSDRFPRYANPSKEMVNEAILTYNEKLDSWPIYTRCEPNPHVSKDIGYEVVTRLINECENPQLLSVLFDLVVDNGPFALDFDKPLFTYYQDPPDFKCPHVTIIIDKHQVSNDDNPHNILRVTAFENTVLVGIADTA